MDFWLEAESCRGVGGVPRGEYLLHVVLAALFGALVTAVLFEGRWRVDAATAIVWIPARSGDVSVWRRLALTGMAPVVLLTARLDLRAVIRLGRGTG